VHVDPAMRRRLPSLRPLVLLLGRYRDILALIRLASAR
jgi:hypothetical protein